MKTNTKRASDRREKTETPGAFPVAAGSAAGREIPSGAAMALCYVPLYDMLMETVSAIGDDCEASREMKALARRGRAVLKHAKQAVYPPSSNTKGSREAR